MQQAQLTQQEIEDWVLKETTGPFHYTKIKDGLIKRELHPTLRTIMHRMKDKGLAYPVGGKDGWWRKAEVGIDEVCWWDGDEDADNDSVYLPLGLNKYGYMSRPALMVVAGVYNQGKTAFCMNVVKLNVEKWKDNMAFFVTEGMEQLKWKFEQLLPGLEKPPPFKVYRRFDNFADVLLPDGLNIIDYLRTDMDKPFTVTNKLIEINKKLKTGVAIVAMQKPPGRKIAFGGGSTAWEPTLYVSLDKSANGGQVLEFEKIKAQKVIAGDPYITKIHFTIRSGVHFVEGSTIVG